MRRNTLFWFGIAFYTISLQTWRCFDVGIKFLEEAIVPEIIPIPPHEMCEVRYPHYSVNAGTLIWEKWEMEYEPIVTWKPKPKTYYLMAMLNPDIPNRTYNIFREWTHWLVGNIPGNKVKYGEVLSAYLAPDGLRERDVRRHVFLVYEQPKKLIFDEDRCTNKTGLRGYFKIYKMAQKYELGDPVFGNYFVTPS